MGTMGSSKDTPGIEHMSLVHVLKCIYQYTVHGTSWVQLFYYEQRHILLYIRMYTREFAAVSFVYNACTHAVTDIQY